MRGPFALAIAMIIEVFLLFLVVLVLIVGVLGFFLPILPGIFFLGIAVALYSLMLKSDYGVITPKVQRVVARTQKEVLNYKIVNNSMGMIKDFQDRKQVKAREAILKYGLILFFINLSLVMALSFGFVSLSLAFSMLDVNELLLAYVPLILIFIFAASSAVVWYRFGQILRSVFKKRKVINASLVTLISFLPMFAILIFVTSLVSLTSFFHNDFLVLAFMGFFLMAILTAVFELMIINFGLTVKQK